MLSWGGINNTYFWIDPSRGIAGTIMMQYLPFADAKALAAYDAFERGAYQLVVVLVSAGQWSGSRSATQLISLFV